MIGSLVPETDEKWYAFLEFLQILEKLWTPKFEKTQLNVLENLIHFFFFEYSKQFPDDNLKAKGSSFAAFSKNERALWSTSKNIEVWSQT